MKKRLIFTLLLAVAIMCMLAVYASATVYYYSEDDLENPIFQYETKTITEKNADNRDVTWTVIDTYKGAFPKTDSDDNPLTWFVVSTETSGSDTVKTVRSVKTGDPRYFTINEGAYSYGGTEGKVATQYNVVSVNFQGDLGITTLSLENDGYRVGTIYAYDYNSTELLFIYLPETLTALPERIIQNTKTIVCDMPSNMPITQISHVAFFHVKNLREINIPSSVVKILSQDEKYGSTFNGCSQLQKVTFGENSNLTTLQPFVFHKCTMLKDITLPTSVTTVGYGVFSECKSLVDCPIPLENNIASFGTDIFYNCTSLKTAIIPACITSLFFKDYYSNCTEVETVKFSPNSQLETIADYCFWPGNIHNSQKFYKIKNVTLPDSVKYVGIYAFRETAIVNSPFTVNSECTFIGHCAFRNCSKLENINMPKDVTFEMDVQNIDAVKNDKNLSMFEGCTSLSEVYFRDDATTEALPAYLFARCTGLTYIKLPNSVKTLSARVFDRCTSLETVVMGANVVYMNYRASDSEGHNSFFYSCAALKNVYLSSALDLSRIESNQCHVFSTADSSIKASDFKKLAIFYDVETYEEALALQNAFKNNVTSCKQNDRILNAEIISIDEFNEKFPDRSVDYDQNYIVYGVNTCEAFYNNSHSVDENDTPSCLEGVSCDRCGEESLGALGHDFKIENGAILTNIVYVTFDKDGYKEIKCVRCAELDKNTVAEAIFVANGYSTNSDGNGYGTGFQINTSALREYERLKDTKITFGIVVFNPAYFNTESIFTNGILNVENGALQVNMDTEYTSCRLLVDGFSEKHVNLELVFAGYAYEGDDKANLQIFQKEYASDKQSPMMHKVCGLDATLYSVKLSSVTTPAVVGGKESLKEYGKTN